MKDKVTHFKQGALIPLQYADITYAGVTPSTLSGLVFYATVEDYEGKTERINLSNVDMDLDDNGGAPVVTFGLDTAPLVKDVLYDYQFWVVDPTYGTHTLDEFFFQLGHRVPDVLN